MKERNLALAVLALSLSAALYSSEAHACNYARGDQSLTTNPDEGVRWPSRNFGCTGPAVVYMWIKSEDPIVWFAYEFARQHWNTHAERTGVTILQAEFASQVGITVHDFHNGSPDDTGIAWTEYESARGSNACASTQLLNKADIFVNLAVSQKFEYGQIYGTAVHELGHAVGLHEDDSRCSAMVSSRITRQEGQCNVYDLTPHDISCVGLQYLYNF